MTVLKETVNNVKLLRGYLNQCLMVILINIPTISFGLAMGWVSLASGESTDVEYKYNGSNTTSSTEEGTAVVVAAGGTFLAALVGVPLSARALACGRKFALFMTSVCMILCWTLKMCGGGWWLVAARVAAGLGGAGAWCIAPLLAREMCSESVRGAAVSFLILAHNLGLLLMYIAADARIPHMTILWWCLCLSICHCFIMLFVPESPSYLAAHGHDKKALKSLSWLRGMDVNDPALNEELASLPPPDDPLESPMTIVRELVSDPRRRRAFIVVLVAVVGQEACGVLALMHFAERVFIIARDTAEDQMLNMIQDVETELATPARYAVILGAVQLAASALALYLVERVGRKPLLVSTALLVGISMLSCAGWAVTGGAPRWGGGVALGLAVGADSAGLQPVPYAMLAEMFHYQYRGCVLMLVTSISCLANAFDVFMFPAVAHFGGLPVALCLAGVITLAYAVFAIICLPETKGRNVEEIYEAMCPNKVSVGEVISKIDDCTETVITSM